MNKNETTTKYYAQLCDITNEVVAFGEVYPDEKLF